MLNSTHSSTYFDRNTESLGYYHGFRYSSMQKVNGRQKMQGVKRVIIFCFLIVVLPAALIIIPLYLRHTVFADVTFPVTESDIIEIRDGISNIFCQQHSLHMNSSFNAYQLKTRPEVSTNHKHIRLKKSMTLPDDTLEYWGFYLLKGGRVELKVCSRYEGSRILVVKGDRNLRTCGLLEHNQNKVGTHFAQGHEKVVVTFETAAEIVVSKERQAPENPQNGKIKKVENEEDENHGGEVLDEEIVRHHIKHKMEKNELNTAERGAPAVHVEEGAIYQVAGQETVRNDSDKTESTLLNSNSNLKKQNETDVYNSETVSSTPPSSVKQRHRRHHRENKKGKSRASRGIYDQHIKAHHDPLSSLPTNKHTHIHKRDVVYNRKISHGGNALNFTDSDSGSISSFENSLLTCYDGQILLAQGFLPSKKCSSVRFFESGKHMVSRHDVVEDGYYYYIFYSDNDLVRNDIHAVFDIYKPTFEYANLTDATVCLNSTNCTFPINFTTKETVIVEVPTRDGIEHEEDDVTYLISTCHPRMAVYLIFPISVLVLILSCAFI